MKKMPFIAAAAVITLFSSCLKNDDFDPSKTIAPDINISVPFTLGSVNFAFSDLTESFSGITESFSQNMTMDGLTIGNINEQIETTLGSAAASFPEPNKTAVESSDGNTVLVFSPMVDVNIGQQSDVTLSGFTSATFSKGLLTFEVTNNWGFDVTNLTIELRNSSNTLLKTLVFASIPNGTSKTVTYDLTNVTIDNVIKTAVTKVSAPAQVNIPINLASKVTVAVSSNNLEIKSGTANIPAQTINNTVTKQINFDDPNIDINSLKVESGNLIIDVDKYDFGASANITITMPALKTSTGAVFTTTLSNLSKTNKANKTIDLTGYSITFTPKNTINANVVATIIAKNNATFNITDEVNASFSLDKLKFSELAINNSAQSIEGANLKDTVAFSLGDLSDDLSSLTLVLNAENTFPIDSLTMDIIDENGNFLLNLVTLANLITKDGNGNRTPNKSVTEISFNKQQLEYLKLAKNLIINGKLDSGAPGSPLKISSSDYFKFIVGLKASVKL